MDRRDPHAEQHYLVFGRSGGTRHVYDKIQLVPFGEYLPLQPLLEAIGLQQLTRGRGGFETAFRRARS